jgi:hypothetical protein
MPEEGHSRYCFSSKMNVFRDHPYVVLLCKGIREELPMIWVSVLFSPNIDSSAEHKTTVNISGSKLA